MHYVSKFLTITPDGKKHASTSLGAAYASLHESDAHSHLANIKNILYKDGTDDIIHLVFSKLEDVIVDLYRMGRVMFHMRSYSTSFSDDGELMKTKCEDHVFSLSDLQNHLILNYAHLLMPIHLEVNMETKHWVYFGGIDSQKKFEIFEEKC